MTDPAAERQPAHARGTDDTARGDEANCLRGRIEVEPGGSTLRSRSPCVLVDLHRPQQREVDDEPAVEDAVPRRVVPAAAHGDLQLVRPGEVERGRYVRRPETSSDRRWATVDEGVETNACRVVLGISGADHLSGERSAQLGQAVIGGRRVVGSVRHEFAPESSSSDW